jgi:hypothetical protein
MLRGATDFDGGEYQIVSGDLTIRDSAKPLGSSFRIS